jgi:hypothetical protein
MLLQHQIHLQYKVMAVQYAFGKIVTNGLVLALDAADRNSYVSGSTTWGDISGNGCIGTLISCSFNSSNGGGIVFNGATGSASVTGVSLQNDGGTINTWVYPNSIGYSGYIVSAVGASTNRYYITQTNANFSVLRGNPAASLAFTNSVTTNQWYNLTATWISSSLSSSMSTYLNGTFVGSVPITASGATTEFAIGNFRSGQTQVFSGSISITQVYNRVLTEIEIQQNYNAQKSRFGL